MNLHRQHLLLCLHSHPCQPLSRTLPCQSAAVLAPVALTLWTQALVLVVVLVRVRVRVLVLVSKLGPRRQRPPIHHSPSRGTITEGLSRR